MYEPSGNKYYYMSDFTSAGFSYSELEKKALESRNKDETYPGQYCDTVVFGGVEMAVDSILTTDPRSAIAQIMSVGEIDSATVNLARPCYDEFNRATKLYNNMEFGMEEGETAPAKLELEVPISGGVNFKWYKNGSLVATDSIINWAGQIAIAVQYSGNTIRNYAYVYTYNNEIYTSGLKGTSAVIQILNAGGSAGSDEEKHGWEDPVLGDFVLSLIFSNTGTDAYTGNATNTYSGADRLANANTNLEDKCDQYGGYLGTELIDYMSGGQGWNYLKTQADLNTPVSVQIPTAVEGEYVTIKCENIGGVGPYFSYYDKDNNRLGYVATSVWERGKGNVYLTWYKQSEPFSSSSRIIMCFYNDNNSQGWYAFSDFNLINAGAEFEDFDPKESELDAIDGYDPDKGQEDDPMEDPEDGEDPEYDPLASGFLYAFMVSGSDMEHLAECLVPDTLAQKIRGDFGNNLFEFIVSYHMMPCLTNASSDNKVNIAYRGLPFLYGENDTQLTLAPITKTWYSVSCGTKVCMPSSVRRPDGFENWSNAHVQLYLPFIGYVHLNTADVWGKAITVVYRFDVLQGTCVANVGVGSNGTMYSFEGSCKYTIPFTSTIDHSVQQMLSGIMSVSNSVMAMGGAVASGSPTGALSSASGIADGVGHFMSAYEHKSTINRGGSLSGSPGWQMPRTPALIITVPEVIEQGTVYNNINGYPCCRSDILGSYPGFYVEVGQIDLKAQPNSDGASPNDTELDMIRSQLKEGVYV